MSMRFWKQIINLQDQFYPDWRKQKPRTLFSTALAGECGEMCGVVTHLDGGGTNTTRYTEEMILEEAADIYIQLVLLLEKSAFTETDFERALISKFAVLHHRLKEKGGLKRNE